MEFAYKIGMKKEDLLKDLLGDSNPIVVVTERYGLFYKSPKMKPEEFNKPRVVWGLANNDGKVKICPLQVEAEVLFIDKYIPASKEDSKAFLETLKNILK